MPTNSKDIGNAQSSDAGKSYYALNEGVYWCARDLEGSLMALVC